VKGRNMLNKALIIISALSILLCGCGAQPGKKALLKQQGLLCSFETLPSETAIGDFDWETNGYVKLEQIKKYATQGKFSAQAVFSVPVDFMTSTKAARVTSWIAGMTMDINTLTQLKVTDWSQYKKFGVDIYQPDNAQRNLFIQFLDAAGNKYITSRPLLNGKNKLEVVIQDVKDTRVDVSNIVSLTFYLDNKGIDKDVTLFFDNVRLTP
jgi:hypothetical protein